MKYRVIKGYTGDIEPHEVFLDNLAKVKEEELGISEKKFEVPLKEKISYVIMGIFLVVASILFLKAFYFQVVQGKHLALAAQNNKGRVSLVVPERGIIYDKDLKKLVSNSPAYDLVCDKRGFSDSASDVLTEINNIAQVLKQDPVEIKNTIETSEESDVLVSENVSHENLLVLEARINEFPGCRIEENTTRNYVDGAIFSSILGYTSKINKDELRSVSDSSNYTIHDYIGKTGIEKFYEEYLRGKAGELEVKKTAVGIEKGTEVVSQAVPGDNLILNIDAGLQKKIYEEMEKRIKDMGAKKGAAVAMNPKTGAVLALVSYPSYDNNLFSGGISAADFNLIQNDPAQPLFNRAIAAQYPTGSTIKPFEAVAALEEKIISPDKKINDIGYIEVKSKYDPTVSYRYGGVTPHGWVDMKEAIAVSSNIYFYTVGGGYKDQKGLGPTRIKSWLEKFGWGSKTGIDLPGEFSGFIPTPEWKQKNIGESWWDGDTYNLSIGQSYLKVTPLQVATAYSAIANGGNLVKPQILNKVVKSLSSEDLKNPIKSFIPEISRSNFFDKESLQVVREGMRDCVQKNYGSAYYLSTLPVELAAKTGTAETSKSGFYNAWTSVFGPYEDPEIVLVVTIESMEGLQSATMPVVYNVLKWYFSK
mgnify:CR=1 FL=1